MATSYRGLRAGADAALAAFYGQCALVLSPSAPSDESLRALGIPAERIAPYASADLLVFTSRTDTLGQVILEAQASGLPVVAVAEGGPRTLIEDGRSGRLCESDPAALASTICELAARPTLRRRLADVALSAVRERSWERSLGRLAEGYERVLSAAEARRTAA